MKQLKILVVDDEDRMRKLVRDFLVRKQYEVVEASNGEESERATQKPTPICITTLEYTFDQQKRTKDINIPRRHPLLLKSSFLVRVFKFMDLYI